MIAVFSWLSWRPSRLFKHLRDQSQCLFRLVPRPAENDEIVGIANKPQAGLFELPIQVIEDDVGQQGGNHTALRRADGSGLEDTVLHHARGKKFFDESENVAIGNLGGDRLHNDGWERLSKNPLMSASRTNSKP